MQKDPVCGMTVSDEKAEKSEYGGKMYYFCGAVCRERFERDPEKYLGGKNRTG